MPASVSSRDGGRQPDCPLASAAPSSASAATPPQLTSVEAGGALRLIAHDAGAVELAELHRFTDPDEAAATIGPREGRPEAVDFCPTHDRVLSGSDTTMLEAAYQAWATNTHHGRTSLLIAGSHRDVTALNTRARLNRIAGGNVGPDGGVDLHDGTRAREGDLCVSRRNHRRLPDTPPAPALYATATPG